MYNKIHIEKQSKRLAFLLRHDVEAFELGLIDELGWRYVDELQEKGFSQSLLEEIVTTNDKQRYEFNGERTKIRARQGHSIPVDVELEKIPPPKILFHGTSAEVKELILKEGIKSMTRLYVHLSEDYDTAKKVGRRHGDNVIVFQVDAERMNKDGCVFYLSRNNVWLTEYVDPKYILESCNHYQIFVGM